MRSRPPLFSACCAISGPRAYQESLTSVLLSQLVRERTSDYKLIFASSHETKAVHVTQQNCPAGRGCCRTTHHLIGSSPAGRLGRRRLILPQPRGSLLHHRRRGCLDPCPRASSLFLFGRLGLPSRVRRPCCCFRVFWSFLNLNSNSLH